MLSARVEAQKGIREVSTADVLSCRTPRSQSATGRRELQYRTDLKWSHAVLLTPQTLRLWSCGNGRTIAVVEMHHRSVTQQKLIKRLLIESIMP